MKNLKKIVLALGGLSAVCAGFAVGTIASTQKAAEPTLATDALSSGIYMIGSFNSWKESDTTYQMYYTTGTSAPYKYYLDITLTQGATFKIFDSEHGLSDKYVGYIDSAITTYGNFTGGGSANVTCALAGTYRITYSFTDINNKQISEAAFTAEGYSTYFLSKSATECASYSLSPTTWGVLSSEYTNATTSDAKASLKAADAPDVGTTIEQFAARYDFIMKKYTNRTSYDNFADRTITSGAAIVVANKSDSSSLVLGGLAVVAVLAAGAYFFVRKKKAD